MDDLVDTQTFVHVVYNVADSAVAVHDRLVARGVDFVEHFIPDEATGKRKWIFHGKIGPCVYCRGML